MVAELAGLLDELVRVERDGGEDFMPGRMRLRAKAQTISGDGLIGALLKAATGKRRRRAAVVVMLWRPDLPQSRREIDALLSGGDADLRSEVLQTIGLDDLAEWAESLNGPMENEQDASLRGCAIHSAASLKQSCNLPALLRLAQKRNPDLNWHVIWALAAFATEDCRIHLERFFEAREDMQLRVAAAWGLAKLGDPRAVPFLVDVLNAPASSHFRAAQALADLFGYPFEWSLEHVYAVRKRIKNDLKVIARL